MIVPGQTIVNNNSKEFSLLCNRDRTSVYSNRGELRRSMTERDDQFVFSRFSWKRLFPDHSLIWSTACWAKLICPFLTTSDTVVSSTYFHESNRVLGDDKSLIINKKSQGPSLVPCGTPDGILPHLDRQALLSLTLCDLSVRKLIIQLMTLRGISTIFSLATRVLWSIKSNAFL